MAKRTRATDAALAEAVRLIRLGLSKGDAALMAGMSRPVFDATAKAGRVALEEGRKCWQADFATALAQAEAGFKLSASAVIINAANGTAAQFDSAGNLVRAERSPDWKAAAWMLERRFAAEYATARNLEVSGAGGGPIEIEVSTVETLVAKVHALRPVSDPLALPPGASNGHSNGVAKNGTNGNGEAAR